MPRVNYRGWVVDVNSVRHATVWRPTITVWHAGQELGRDPGLVLAPAGSFHTEADADAAGIARAKNWIDEQG